MPVNLLRQFLKLESSSGIVLLIVTALALVCSNSLLSSWYDDFLNINMVIGVGSFEISKPLLLWINDGLMAIFFLLVGLELKREMLIGRLRGLSKLSLPVFAAVGGIVAPALIYIFFNHANKTEMNGWAIPTATDIAFALAVLSIFGRRVPVALKLFLMALAIIDDIGAIVIIGFFHSHSLSVLSLVMAGIVIVALYVLNRKGVRRLTPFVLLGILLWICVVKSGIHATLAGVFLAFAIPLRENKKHKGEEEEAPLENLEEALHPWVAFLVMPVFAFANAGIPLKGIGWDTFTNPVLIGIVAGLFIGKQVGVFFMTWLIIKLRLAHMPEGCGWLDIYAVSLICGIGFTMSLFIGSLAFQDILHYKIQVRLGVIVGSLISGISGALLLAYSLKRKKLAARR
jgi:Na+:H+ antiporter, NhaA family